MTRLPAEFDRARTALGRLLGPFAVIRELPSGAGGLSVLIESRERQYVAKVFAADAPVLLGPAAQFALLGPVAAAGIAPFPVGFDTDARLLVTDFIADAAAVPVTELGNAGNIAAIAGLLRRLHALDLELPPFTPAAYAELYLADIGGRSALGAADRRRFDELLELVAMPLPGPACPCHNDLLVDNLLLGPAPRLIDFDYAVIATPAVDLASVVFMNGFDDAAGRRLLESYYGDRVPLTAAEFARVQQLVRLLAHFWALAQPLAGTDSLAQYRIDND